MEEQKVNKENQQNSQQGEAFDVPPGGSLGLLALGAVGIRAWRKARNEWEKKEAAKKG